MLTIIQGRLFCEASDITGVNESTKKWHLSNARQKASDNSYPVWYNQPNPGYNGKNSKRIVMVDTLPSDIKDRVLADFKADVAKLQRGFEQAQKQGEDITAMVGEATAQVVSAGEQFVQSDIIQYVDKYYHKYTEYYIELGIPDTRQVVKYARTCALCMKVWESVAGVNPDNRKLYRTIIRSLILNITNAMAGSHLNVVVPSSEARLTQWLYKVVDALLQSKEVYEVVEVKNMGNKHRERFTEEQRQVASHLRKQSAKSMTAIYEQLLQIAQECKWWIEGGKFSPISITTLQRYYMTQDNLLSKKRDGHSKFINLIVPAISRTVPTEKNSLWGIDGSPVDLYIYDTKAKKSLQSMNSIRVYDYATGMLLAIYCYKGGGEKVEYLIEAMRMAIRNVGYLPRAVNFDNGPASLEFKLWCKENNMVDMPSSKGNARSKLIEQLLGQFAYVLSKHPAYTGQNRTARGRNSVLSPEALMQAQKHANTFERTEQWLQNEGMKIWSSRVMEQYGREVCGKSPSQLWEEKPSATTKLSAKDYARMGGYAHEVKLTIEGLTIQNKYQQYTYFPDIFREQGFERGLQVFATTPLEHHPENGKLAVCVKFYGDSEAYIFDRKGKYLDTWLLKPNVSMVATWDGDTQKLAVFQRFQQAIKDLADRVIAHSEEVANLSMLSTPTNDAEVFNPLNKEIIHEQEMGIQEPDYEEQFFTNAYTGELISVKQLKTA